MLHEGLDLWISSLDSDESQLGSCCWKSFYHYTFDLFLYHFFWTQEVVGYFDFLLELYHLCLSFHHSQEGQLFFPNSSSFSGGCLPSTELALEENAGVTLRVILSSVVKPYLEHMPMVVIKSSLHHFYPTMSY